MANTNRPPLEDLRATYNRYVALVNMVHAMQADVDAVYPEAKAALNTIKEAFPALHDYILELEAERENWRRFCKHVTTTHTWNMLDEDEFDGERFEIDELLFLMGGTPVGEDAASDTR
jgi:chemotaxis methyl-accepting protein methylase